MSLIWPVVKSTLIYTWEESLYLVIFNIITLIAVASGPVLLLMGLDGMPILLPIDLLLFLSAPPAIFGLFWLAYQISEGKAVKLSTYFTGARVMLKSAYIWGGINLFVILLLASNIIFYRRVSADWAVYAAAFFLGLAAFWFTLQLLALSLYPRLVEPDFKLAMKNTLALLSMQPVLVVVLLIISGALLLLGITFPLTVVLVSLSFIALLTNMTTAEILKRVPKAK